MSTTADAAASSFGQQKMMTGPCMLLTMVLLYQNFLCSRVLAKMLFADITDDDAAPAAYHKLSCCICSCSTVNGG